MPKKVFYLNPEETETIEITWKFNWKSFKAFYQDELVGEMNGLNELKNGGVFILKDGRELSIKLEGKFSPDLVVLLDGDVVPGSSTDPQLRLDQTVKLGIFVGAFTILGSIIAEVYQFEFFVERGLDWYSAAVGLLIVILSVGAFKKLAWSIWLIILIVGVDTLASLYYSVESGSNPVNGLFVKGFIIYYLYRGIGAIKAIKKESEIPLFE